MRILVVLFLAASLVFANEEGELTCTYQNLTDTNVVVPEGKRVVLCYRGHNAGSLSVTGSGKVYVVGLSSSPQQDVLKGSLRLYGSFEKVYVYGLTLQGLIDTQGFKNQVPEDVVLKDVILISSHKVSLHAYGVLSVAGSVVNAKAPVYMSAGKLSILNSLLNVDVEGYHRYAVQIDADFLTLSGSVVKAKSFPERGALNFRVWHSLHVTDSVLLGWALSSDENHGILISVGKRGFYTPSGSVSIVNSVFDGEGSASGVILQSASGKLSFLTVSNAFITGNARNSTATYDVYLKKLSDFSNVQNVSVKAKGGRQTYLALGNPSTPVTGIKVESTSSVFISASLSGSENLECIVSGKSLKLEGNLSLCKAFAISGGVVLFSDLIDRTEVRASGEIDVLPLQGTVKVYKSTFYVPYGQRVFIEWLSQDSQQNCFEKKLVLPSATYLPSSALYQWGKVLQTCP